MDGRMGWMVIIGCRKSKSIYGANKNIIFEKSETHVSGIIENLKGVLGNECQT